MYIDDRCHDCEKVFVYGVTEGGWGGLKRIEEVSARNLQTDSKSRTYHAMTNGELNTWSFLPDDEHKLIAIGK